MHEIEPDGKRERQTWRQVFPSAWEGLCWRCGERAMGHQQGVPWDNARPQTWELQRLLLFLKSL